MWAYASADIACDQNSLLSMMMSKGRIIHYEIAFFPLLIQTTPEHKKCKTHLKGKNHAAVMM
jgi:hypothetical protein